MDEKTAKIIIGMLSVLLILSNGAQYVLNETGKELRCYSGWEFQATGDNEGSYACYTSTGVRYSYCTEVRNATSGRENFYCKEAIPVLINQTETVVIEPDDLNPPPITPINGIWGTQYSCYVNGECVEI